MKTDKPAEPSPEVAPMQDTGVCAHCGKAIEYFPGNYRQMESAHWLHVETQSIGCKDGGNKMARPGPAVAPRETQTALQRIPGDLKEMYELYGTDHSSGKVNLEGCYIRGLIVRTGGAEDVLYRLLQFVWLAGYSDTSPIVAEAEAFVRARLEGRDR